MRLSSHVDFSGWVARTFVIVVENRFVAMQVPGACTQLSPQNLF